ncbi:MAG: hypothetical protein IPK02_00260 [Candidatus Accumulibacter sp.]|uniref:Uncharacterized protein n=1 Tax=Candidatus Accumulibacter affinis TaxID=2954384 RepID=A0A935T721_9PROT|nr:hypothetical protein [Candidatus Accumulibacter affinis]
MVARTQLLAASKVGVSPLMLANHYVALLDQPRNHEVAGIGAIGNHDVTRLQLLRQTPQERGLPGFLTLTRTNRPIQDGSTG